VPNITLLEGLDGYSKHELLEQFKVSINISSSPVSEIQIVTENSSISDNDSLGVFGRCGVGFRLGVETEVEVHVQLLLSHRV
jgi:hypothetical protein